jgi:hypothetical protein
MRACRTQYSKWIAEGKVKGLPEYLKRVLTLQGRKCDSIFVKED